MSEFKAGIRDANLLYWQGGLKSIERYLITSVYWRGPFYIKGIEYYRDAKKDELRFA